MTEETDARLRARLQKLGLFGVFTVEAAFYVVLVCADAVGVTELQGSYNAASARLWLWVGSARLRRAEWLRSMLSEIFPITMDVEVSCGCPCEGPDEDPGPHLAECPWNDPDFGDNPF